LRPSQNRPQKPADTGLVPVGGPAPGGDLVSRDAAKRLIEAFFGGRSPDTERAYREDLGRFRRFTGAKDLDDLARRFLGLGPGMANDAVIRFKNALLGAKKAPKTINRHLSAIRSFVRFARTLGMIVWSLEVKGVKDQTYRDTRGPGLEKIEKLFAAARSSRTPARDEALLRMIFDLGLRASEVAKIDLEHVALADGHVAIKGKGHLQRQDLTLPDETSAALLAWLEVRGLEPGPVFGLTRKSVWRVVNRLGKRAGFKVWPHGLRHTAITTLLDMTGGDVRAVRRFSRHAHLQTLVLYDDARGDVAGELAKKLAGRIKKGDQE